MQTQTQDHYTQPAPSYEPDINTPAPAKLLPLDRVGLADVGRKLRVYGEVMQYHPDLALLVISSQTSPDHANAAPRPTLLINTASVFSSHMQGSLSSSNHHIDQQSAPGVANPTPGYGPKPLMRHTDDQDRTWTREPPRTAELAVRLEPGMRVSIVGWVDRVPSSLLPTYRSRLQLNPCAFASPPAVLVEGILIRNV